jgi:hypothetical protein
MKGLLSKTGFERYQVRLDTGRHEGMPDSMADIITGNGHTGLPGPGQEGIMAHWPPSGPSGRPQR